MKRQRGFHVILKTMFVLILILKGAGVFAENIDPAADGSRYAYGENIGWINFKPSLGPGVTVTDSTLTGYAWGENIGWVHFDPTSGGVVNDGAGHLSGYAWGENVGWIHFAPTGGGVQIDPATGGFGGYAWGENIGWINFAPTGGGVATSWRPPDSAAPVVTPPSDLTVPATEAGGAKGNASAALAAFLAGGSPTDAVDPSPTRLSPQVAGADAGNNTLFPIGTTPVTFRFQDAAGNIGLATANVTVTLGRPRLSGKIVSKGRDASGAIFVDLQLTNTGTGHGRNIAVNQILLRTLSGSGTVILNGPPTPLTVGSLDVGASTTLRLSLNVPSTVTKSSITENGTAQDVAGTSFSYSIGQGVVP